MKSNIIRILFILSIPIFAEQPTYIINKYRTHYIRIMPVIGIGPRDTTTKVGLKELSIEQNRGIIWGIGVGLDIPETPITTNVQITNNNQVTLGIGLNF